MMLSEPCTIIFNRYKVQTVIGLDLANFFGTLDHQLVPQKM
ncbi:MAG TPA: hypothetical protein VMW89_08980 [Desulfatiglandales bacterium]|nr:hypothetical protein [Desulfatiglandales bacterium]